MILFREKVDSRDRFALIDEDLQNKANVVFFAPITGNVSQSFNAASIDVYYNGVKQRNPNEFTVTSGATIRTTFTPSSLSTLTELRLVGNLF